MGAARVLLVSVAAAMFILLGPWGGRAGASGADAADLSSIFQGAGALTPSFDPSVTEYWVRMKSTLPNYFSSAIPKESGALLEYSMNGASWNALPHNTSTGYIGTNRGENVFQFRVTSADTSTTKTYTIHVYFPMGDDADLFDLQSTGATLYPAFNPATESYTATVPYTTSAVSIAGELSDPAASFTVNSTAAVNGLPFGPIPLSAGSNTITVRTLSNDQTAKKTYTITVTRAAPSTNAELSALTVAGSVLSPIFSPDQANYTLPDVSYGTSHLTVTPTAADSTSQVQVRVNEGGFLPVGSGSTSSPLALKVGINSLQIIVTAQDGTTTNTYTVTVKRLNGESSLSGLEVSSGTLAFTSLVANYELAVSQATSAINVKPALPPDNDTATIQIRVNGGVYYSVRSGTDSPALPLETGAPNIIDVLITAEDGTNRLYTITVYVSGTPVLQHLTFVGTQAALTFSEPLMHVATDATYYTIYNVTRRSALSVTQVAHAERSAEVNLTVSGLLLPGDELEFRIEAGAVAGMIGERNADVSRTIWYGDPMQQMMQRLADLDTEHDGIHINEIVAYMNTTPFGRNDLNGDGVFDREDVLILLNQIGAWVAPLL